MKTRIVNLLLAMSLAPMAHAGVMELSVGAEQASSFLVPSQAQLRLSRDHLTEVPVTADCHPSFVPGDDGIFRRTDYCHKANPDQANGFLMQGYDVPAAFLAGFTEADVVARWQGMKFQVPGAMAARFEVPKELYSALNLTAAQAWEKTLACAKGDADLARELYRTGLANCKDQAVIRSLLADLRSSLSTLASSVDVAGFFDGSRLHEWRQEAQERIVRVYQENANQDPRSLRREVEKLHREQRQIFQLDVKVGTPEMIEALAQYLPRMPRMHPLATQLLFEEVLSLMAPDENPKAVADRYKRDRSQQIAILQYILWLHSIEDRTCSSLGLWPSANRVAMETFGDVFVEIMNHLGAPPRQVIRNFHLVGCPMGRSLMPKPGESRGNLLASEQAQQVMRLGEVYTQGRFHIWRELLEVRARYTNVNGK